MDSADTLCPPGNIISVQSPERRADAAQALPLCGEAVRGIVLQGEKIAERAEAVVARADQLIRFDGAERAQLARKEYLEGGEHDAVAAGFEQDAVDDAESVQVGGGHLQTLGRVGDLGGVLPEDRSAALGRDDRVDRVFGHPDLVGHG